MESLKGAEYGYLALTDEEEAAWLGMCVSTIKKYHKKLIDLGYLDYVEVNGQKLKRFHLKKLAES